ncbi:MAG: MFS transporter [Chloroflexota bacterium]
MPPITKLIKRLRSLEKWEKVLYITFAAQLINVVGFSSIFPFLPLYVDSLGSRFDLSIEFLSGLVFSSQAFTMMIAAPIWGALADRYGRKLMMVRAMFGGAVLVFWMGYVSSAEMLIFVRALQGLVTGTISAANALIAATVPRDKLGYGLGLNQVALWGGVSFGPLIGGLIADASGYRATFILTAVLLVLGGILTIVGVEENFEPTTDDTGNKPSILEDWKHILAAPGVKMAYLVRFLMTLGRTILVPIAPLFIIQLLPGNAPINFYTGLVIATSGAASTITAVWLGKIGDKIGHRRVLLLSSLWMTIFYLPQGLVTAAWQLLVLQLLTGAGLGGLITAVTSLLAQYTRPGEEGSVFGFDSALVSGGRVLAPLLGAGVAYWVSLRAALSLTGVLFLVIFFIVMYLIPQPKKEGVISYETPA